MTPSTDRLEANKSFIRDHFEEFVNRKNSAIAYKNFAEDFLDHDEMGGPTTGPEPAKLMMERMYEMFPDLRVVIEDIIAEGEKVVVRNIWSATNREGHRVQFKGFVLWRLQNGLIAERWATVTGIQELGTTQPGW